MKIQPLTYSDWFGSGSCQHDLLEVIREKKEEPIAVYLEAGASPHERYTGRMILIEFKDSHVVTGYDGNEYHLTFEFPREFLQVSGG